ncbi:phosphoribosyltransferase family protein [Uliginosibacterium sp. 31-12]|uniref:phosphoribosyltransferase family protein n=1 Tax=Uliginosibacterium sp. 31-12 TaxID=3062781 RepID=UPI0026E2016A|nr:phosphoribosyltransferase family protein [Uliginosibacterium sp. 31-12]MDO6388173.1 phosphoribosyltransferase family protein [Uliginosibacterium sp. 31-12]
MKNLEPSQCAFNLIYSFDPMHSIDGILVQDYRRKLAESLAAEVSKKKCRRFDFVVPIPMTGILYAKYVSEYLNIPYIEIFDREKRIRTLDMPNGERVKYYNEYFSSFESSLVGKSILVVDEALISGTTAMLVSKWLAKFKAKNYSFAFASPPMSGYCPNKYIKESDRAIADGPVGDALSVSIRKFADRMEADDIYFVSSEGFQRVIYEKTRCMLCFSQIYG